MDLEKFGEIIDNFLKENHVQMLIDMPEGTIEPIVKDKTSAIVENERFLDCEVVAFGFYENEFCVRIRKEELK